MRWPGNSPRFTYQEIAEGTRFENPTALETIGSDRVSLVCSGSLTEDSEGEGEPIKSDRTK